MGDLDWLACIRRMHEDEINAGRGTGWIDPKTGRVAVVHGFRSTFRDWYNENEEIHNRYPKDAAEIALSHRVGSTVEHGGPIPRPVK